MRVPFSPKKHTHYNKSHTLEIFTPPKETEGACQLGVVRGVRRLGEGGGGRWRKDGGKGRRGGVGRGLVREGFAIIGYGFAKN